MTDWNELHPDDLAFKAELEQLAAQIQPNPTFLADLEKRLAQQVQTQSMQAVQTPKQSRFSPTFLAVAAMMLIAFCLATSVLGIRLTKDDECDEDCIFATPLSATNMQIIAAQISSETAISQQSTGTAQAITEVALLPSATWTITTTATPSPTFTITASPSGTPLPTVTMVPQQVQLNPIFQTATQAAVNRGIPLITLAPITATPIPSATIAPPTHTLIPVTPQTISPIFQTATSVIAKTLQPYQTTIANITGTPAPLDQTGGGGYFYTPTFVMPNTGGGYVDPNSQNEDALSSLELFNLNPIAGASTTPPPPNQPNLSATELLNMNPIVGASMAAPLPTQIPNLAGGNVNTTGLLGTPTPLPTQVMALPTVTAFPTQVPFGTNEPLFIPSPPPMVVTPVPNVSPEAMPPDMFFQNYGVNPFLDTQDDSLSTFALDVDSASYTLARDYLVNVRMLPPAAAIRSEEMVNYFDYDYPNPEGAFGITLEAAPAPFGYEDHYLLQVGIQGQTIANEDREPTLFIFVIDVSGSMADGGRLELVKRSLELLVSQLTPQDRVGIVVYTDYATPLLAPVSAENDNQIMAIINGLYPQNSTNAEDGLRVGYDMADMYRLNGENTRLVLFSDGVANVGVTDSGGILERVRNSVGNQITLTAIGVGMGNYNDVLLEQLANDGDGNYYYVDTLREAQRVLVENLLGTFYVIGYDAKIQVEFNPQVTDRYRLIGYENRAVADSDFRNDAVDAGEVGAGQQATALYELALESGDVNGVIATVYVRYQDADTREVVEIRQDITTRDLIHSSAEISPRFRLAATVAEFSELLRGSYWAQEGSYADLITFAQPLPSLYPDEAEVRELLDLIRLAGQYVDR